MRMTTKISEFQTLVELICQLVRRHRLHCEEGQIGWRLLAPKELVCSSRRTLRCEVWSNKEMDRKSVSRACKKAMTVKLNGMKHGQASGKEPWDDYHVLKRPGKKRWLHRLVLRMPGFPSTLEIIFDTFKHTGQINGAWMMRKQIKMFRFQKYEVTKFENQKNNKWLMKKCVKCLRCVNYLSSKTVQ